MVQLKNHYFKIALLSIIMVHGCFVCSEKTEEEVQICKDEIFGSFKKMLQHNDVVVLFIIFALKNLRVPAIPQPEKDSFKNEDDTYRKYAKKYYFYLLSIIEPDVRYMVTPETYCNDNPDCLSNIRDHIIPEGLNTLEGILHHVYTEIVMRELPENSYAMNYVFRVSTQSFKIKDGIERKTPIDFCEQGGDDLYSED